MVKTKMAGCASKPMLQLCRCVSLMENWFFAGGGNNKIDMCEAFVSLVISSIFLWLLLNEQ
ncbi:unnamed protein product [Musa acuminata var. zebrina]